jgi:hypothetical protein
MTGISPLFPAFPKQMSILDRVNITVARHKNDICFEKALQLV